LENVALLESLNEGKYVCPNVLDGHPELNADRVGNLGLVEALLQQCEDVRADHIEGKNSAVTKVEKDSAVSGSGASNCVGNCENPFTQDLPLIRFNLDG
jgi:hypothetical protein